MSIRVRVVLFAFYRDLAGTEEIEVELPAGATVTDLADHVRARGGGLARLPRDPVVAVNREYAAPERVLADGDEVAFLPPIAGG
jgi:molybdopterin converting factor subunit 1